MDQIPTYSIDLIKELDKQYPHRHPLLTETDREIFYKAGQRSLVDKLLAFIKDDNEGELPKVLSDDS